MKYFLEKSVEALIKGCGFLSAAVVLMIVFFLFREGVSFINSSPLEDHTALFVHRDNTVVELTDLQVKNLFDKKISNWKELGSFDQPVNLISADELDELFTSEQLGANLEYLSACVNHYMDTVPGTIAYFSEKQLGLTPVIKTVKVRPIHLWYFLSGKEWFPTAQPAAIMGTLPLLLGTLLVSIIAILIALPLGLAAAVYLAEIADDRLRRILKPVIELLSGIPSVVYGFFGLVVIVPFIQQTLNLPVGETALAGSILLAIMALPTIITVSEDAIRTCPVAIKEASLALGASHWQTIFRVIIPYASSGISAAAILGIGRAIGETMAVLMVTGNAALLPTSLTQSVRTIPATIAAELGEAPFGGLHFKALFALGCILFIITLGTNLLVERISKRKINK